MPKLGKTGKLETWDPPIAIRRASSPCFRRPAGCRDFFGPGTLPIYQTPQPTASGEPAASLGTPHEAGMGRRARAGQGHSQRLTPMRASLSESPTGPPHRRRRSEPCAIALAKRTAVPVEPRIPPAALTATAPRRRCRPGPAPLGRQGCRRAEVSPAASPEAWEPSPRSRGSRGRRSGGAGGRPPPLVAACAAGAAAASSMGSRRRGPSARPSRPAL